MTQPPPMSLEPKPTLTPKLRFPEFRDAPGWEETLLGSVLTEHGEKNDGASEVHSVSVHKGVVNQVEHLGRSFAAADRSNYNLAKPHDVIYTKSPTGDFPWGVIKQNRLSYNVIVSPLYGVFSPVNRYLGYILDAYFESPIRTTNYLAPITQKGAKNTIQISNPTFLSKGLYLPSIEAEHKKIAECLTSLDELIAAHGQKLDALTAHKHGLIQQLFPRAGETLPRLRFPEFRDASAWKTEKLGAVASLTTERAGNKTCIPMSITSGVGLVSQQEKFGRTIAGNQYKNYLVLQKNDFAYNKSATKEFPQGFIAMYSRDEPAAVPNSIFTCFRTNETKIVPTFLNYLFMGNLHGKWLKKYIEVSARAHGSLSIDDEDILSLPVPLPSGESSRVEQQKIADCLSLLDELIAAQAQKFQALKTHKKGLMQQLFPSPEERT